MIMRKDGLNVSERNIRLLALSSHYFTIALVDRSQVLPRFEIQIPAESPDIAEPANLVAVGKLIHAPVGAVADFGVKYTAYSGPKSLSSLMAVDEQLATVINFGMFSWIAKPLLWLLKFLYSFFQNYGLAIIFLTIIVRLIVLPFNVYSFKSMKVMQKLQPEMQRLRERYKSDPPTMNREIMELMKRNKANPLGGCLPMLLQLPVFIALYQVLGQSIELYRAPFMLWIQDLSVMDKWYVLPVLMTVTMWVQQKITPTTMDPAQAKVLQWMPVVFGLMMISLPSGLTLYIFVSTLFGIIQQYLFMREKTPNAKVSHAQA
jgi:YidC/Oxa1 family membrane protein insertase